MFQIHLRVSVVLAVFASHCLSGHCADDEMPTATRLRLRNDTAIHYTAPESHLRLARYHYDLGNKVQAFYIAEYAREMFGDEQFTPAFQKVARVTLKDPRVPSPKDKLDEDKALSSYIDLYFSDPHYYDGEYAEFRIKTITSSRKQAWWEGRKKDGIPLEQLIAEEKNPRVLDVVVTRARERWEPSMVPAMFSMLGNDDPSLQSQALHMLLAHSNDVTGTKAEEIKGMLKGEDLVKRAMAALLLVKCFGPAEYPLLKEGLDSGIELVQVDTIQALSQIAGQEGRAYLRSNRPAKASPKVMTMWRESTGESPSSTWLKWGVTLVALAGVGVIAWRLKMLSCPTRWCNRTRRGG
jgi:hypothetical protein